MPLLQNLINYGETFPSVLAVAEGLRSPRHVDIAGNLYTPSTQLVFPPGMFVSAHSGGKFRLLPRAVVTANTTTGQAVVTVNPRVVGAFLVGDVIAVINNTAAGGSGGAVGTIQSINYATGAITLAANSGTALTANTSIVGVVAAVPFGMISPNTAIDFTVPPDTAFGVFTSAAIKTARMPHWDNNLAALFPEITPA